jgi:hypothetical protein
MNRLLPLLLPAALLAGCASSVTPNYDARFGDAVRQARTAMTLNPSPPSTTLTGMDGIAAHEAAKLYHDSYKAPPPVVNVINIGGAVGSGGR